MKPDSFTPFSLRLPRRLMQADRPQVMAILNATPDSFYAASRADGADAIARRTERLIADGADMIDLGAYSSRPGAADVSPQEETSRLLAACRAIRSVAPDIPLSVDTFRAEVARIAVEEGGADIINDITGGNDPEMLPTVARLGVPYIAMHMRGTPDTMQSMTQYPDDDPTGEIIARLSDVIERCSQLGIADVIADPGLGFAKTMEQNYRVLRHTPVIARALRRPLLIGLSRKSMLTRALGITPEDALPATVAADTMALMLGASIIRVHDPREASQTVKLFELLKNS